jgi:hypothetical protein
MVQCRLDGSDGRPGPQWTKRPSKRRRKDRTLADEHKPRDAASPAGDREDEATRDRERPDLGRVGRPARRALGALRDGVVAAAGGVASAAEGVASAAEPIVDRVGQAIEGAGRSWNERPGARVRRVRRMGRNPLANLYELHPEARQAVPVQVGLITIDVDEIAGTAVGGGDQRGGDFLPLKPFRGGNWHGRWQRLRTAQDRLAVLPPIEVVKYAGGYWVIDGHNRVALALYGGQLSIDATVVELVPPGGRRTEPIQPLTTSAADSRSVRTAASGQQPSHALSRNDPVNREPTDDAS